jgi:hypothetical protein
MVVSPPLMKKTLFLMIVLNKCRLCSCCFWEGLVTLFCLLLLFSLLCPYACQTLNFICLLKVWHSVLFEVYMGIQMIWWYEGVGICMFIVVAWSISGCYSSLGLFYTWSISGGLFSALWSYAWSLSGCCLYGFLHAVGSMHVFLSSYVFP